MSATARLLDFARARHSLDSETWRAATDLLGDTLAVGAAGVPLSVEAGITQAVAGWGECAQSRALGSNGRLPAPSAAFLNGFRIHCLEWDAVHSGAVVHPLSVVTAALGAVIDRRGGCEEQEAVTALGIGVDVASGLGIGSTGAMRFFRPATAGVIGAALAIARIERICRFEDVLGLAYSQAAGTMQAHAEGSIALPLQIAHAARAAVTAVDLVASGATGPHDVLEGPFGFFRNFEEGDLTRYTNSIGERWLIREVAAKPFPSGRASHGVLGTLYSLLQTGQIAPEQIDRVQAFVPPLVHRLVGRPMAEDMTAPYARLCLPFLTGLMLAEGRIDPRRFTTDAFRDATIRAGAAKLSVSLDGSSDPNALEPQRLVVTDIQGGRIEQTIDHALGSPQAPMSSEQTRRKRELARDLAGPSADQRIFDDPLTYFTEPK